MSHHHDDATPRLEHLPALDGLRAIAVALVVAYHLDLGWVPGGFLGVDLFFVISGFLITTLLLDEHRATGRIGIMAFWVRRFRRLVPPLVVMVAASVFATRAWGIPEQWGSVRADAVAALGYVANWRFVLGDQSYFDTLLGPSPLRHTWSLAVEEQWYLLWPIVVAALGRGSIGRSRGTPGRSLVLIGVAAVASAAAMAWWYEPSDASRVYYGTDTRAQQLLVGAGLAYLIAWRPSLRPSSTSPRSRAAFAWVLATFVGLGVVVADDSTWLYRGGFLGVSLLAGVVVAGTIGPAASTPLAWLGRPLLVAVGRRSYGIYLWHWPVIVFVGPPMGLGIDGIGLDVVRVLVTLVLTEVSYRLVEQPVRRGRRSSVSLVTTWTAGGVAVGLVSMLVLVAPADRQQVVAEVLRPDFVTAGTDPDGPRRTAPDATNVPAQPRTGDEPTPTPSGATDDSPATTSASPEVVPVDDTSSAPAGGAGQNAAQASGPPHRILLVGDSTAVVLSVNLPGDHERRWDVQRDARLGCAVTGGATIDVGSQQPTVHGEICASWRQDWEESVRLVRPDVVVMMIGAWEVLDHRVDGVDLRFPSDSWTAHVRAGVEDAVALASGSGSPVAMLTLPCMNQAAGGSFSTAARNDPRRVDAFNAILDDVAEQHVGVYTLPLAELLCPGGVTPARSIDGAELRYDGVHLTPFGATLVWEWLDAQLESTLPTGATM